MTYTPIYTSVAYVQAKTGLSNCEVDLTVDANISVIIEDAEVEVENLTGRKFTSGNSITEWLSIKDKDIIGNNQTNVVLNHFPVQSLSVLNIVDANDNASSTFAALTSVQVAAGTYSTVDYWLETQNDPLTNSMVPNGKIRLKTQSFPKGTNVVKATYTYGYASVPVAIRDLATCLAGIRCWIKFLGGQYNRLNSYAIPQQNVDKGNFYDRGMQNIANLQMEADRLLDRVGRKPRTLFFATGDAR